MAEAVDDGHGALLATFSELTGANTETAAHVLEAHEWDLNSSVDFYFLEGRPLVATAAAARGDSIPHGDEEFARALAEADRADPLAGVRGVGVGAAQGGVAFGGLPDFPAFQNANGEGAAEGVAHGGDGGLGDDDDPVVVSDSESPVHRAPPRHEDPFLPDGINIEEARMLEAAMLGTAYEGRMPDFANPMPPSDAPTDPAIVEERFLREEQDAAYQASLAADRERVAAEEAARREAKETAAREHEEKVMEQRRQEEDERAYRSIVESKRAGLGAEPEEGERVIQLQVRMPDGTRLARRFCTSDTMAYVFDFVDVSVAEQAEGKPHELMPGSYKLATQFPRRVFTAGQEGTLDSHGLNHKQEALFLQKQQ